MPDNTPSPPYSHSEEFMALKQKTLKRVGTKSIVLIGLMGAGKSSVGRRLATRLNLPFVDADNAIEEAAGMSIADIFSLYGEAFFRDGEKRVIARLLQSGPQVLATGGGAYLNDQTQEVIAQQGISVWLKADLDTLMQRVSKRAHRPLLQTEDPEGTMQKLMDARYPIYAKADYTVYSRDEPHEAVVDEIIDALCAD
jgi:shikimate kinase